MTAQSWFMGQFLSSLSLAHFHPKNASHPAEHSQAPVRTFLPLLLVQVYIPKTFAPPFTRKSLFVIVFLNNNSGQTLVVVAIGLSKKKGAYVRWATCANKGGGRAVHLLSVLEQKQRDNDVYFRITTLKDKKYMSKLYAPVAQFFIYLFI